jgi:hypothetical protein
MINKYVICPGFVQSIIDEDEHFVSAGELMELYGVPPSECIVHDFRNPRHRVQRLSNDLRVLDVCSNYEDYERIREEIRKERIKP